MFEKYNFNDNQFSWRRSPLGHLWRVLVVRPALAWQAWRCSRAKTYLLTHDYDYRSEYIGSEIVRQRNIHYDQGGSPAAIDLPDRWSVNEELQPMAWPHGIEGRG